MKKFALSQKPSIFVLAFSSLTLLTSFQNCSPEPFATLTKDRKLAASPVFAYAATGTINVGGGAAGGNINTVGGSGSGNINSGGGSGSGGGSFMDDMTGPGMPGLPGMGGGGGSGMGGGGSGMGGRGSGMGGTPGTNNVNNMMGVPDPKNPMNVPSTTTTDVPVKFICSTVRSQSQGNVAEATSLTIRLSTNSNDTGTPACEFTDTGLRDTILQTKKIPLSLVNQKCPNLADGHYYLFVRETGKTTDLNSNVGMRSGQSLGFGLNKAGQQWTIQQNDTLSLIMDFNSQTGHAMLVLKPEQCDMKASPLMVRLEAPGAAPEALNLSSPADGVLFDILGANASPTPYKPVQISWMRNEPQFFFVALPDLNGQVRGVDQLFGDNTKGPDGQFAENGFLALAKYDKNADGVITAADPIFSKLRLWRDDNGDGIAQSSELYSLPSLGLSSIDLNYDPNYHEADQYGNEIKFKSVARTSDGRMHIIFDLWFSHK